MTSLVLAWSASARALRACSSSGSIRTGMTRAAAEPRGFASSGSAQGGGVVAGLCFVSQVLDLLVGDRLASGGAGLLLVGYVSCLLVVHGTGRDIGVGPSWRGWRARCRLRHAGCRCRRSRVSGRAVDVHPPSNRVTKPCTPEDDPLLRLGRAHLRPPGNRARRAPSRVAQLVLITLKRPDACHSK